MIGIRKFQSSSKDQSGSISTSIIELYDYCISKDHPGDGDASPPASKHKEVIAVFEWCAGGTLVDLIERRTLKAQQAGGGTHILKEQEILKILEDVSAGLMMLHLKNVAGSDGEAVAHRGVSKVEKILLSDTDMKWKIGGMKSAT